MDNMWLDSLKFRDGFIIGGIAWMITLMVLALLLGLAGLIIECVGTTNTSQGIQKAHITSRTYKEAYVTTYTVMIGKIPTIQTLYHPAEYRVGVYVESLPKEEFVINDHTLYLRSSEAINVEVFKKSFLGKPSGYSIEWRP